MSKGTVNFVSLTSNNYKGVEMEGIDFDINYVMDTDNMGRFDMGLNAAKITKYVYQRFASDAVIATKVILDCLILGLIHIITWGKGDWAVWP